MIVVFLIVLVVFGPQKLPELARSFGKLMAEFRKASNDFKSAFEEEMRDLERQARIAELKKQVAEATAASNIASQGTPAPASPAPAVPSSEPSDAAAATPSAEGPVITPIAESVPRLDATNGESAPSTSAPQAANADHDTSDSPAPSHDQQQPA
jgi:sec-independent protein translocase protein TatB